MADATRERIKRIAAELGYRPSRSARALRSSRTHTLGLISPSLQNPAAIEQLSATVQEAYALGYTVFVSDTQDSAEIQAAELSRMLEHRVDGVIFGRGVFHLTADLEEFLNSQMPVEGHPGLSSRGAHDSYGTPYPENDELDRHATVVVGRHLRRYGHKKVALISRNGPTSLGEARFEALRQAFRDDVSGKSSISRIEIDAPELCSPEMQRVLAMPHRPTAVVVSTGLFTPYVLEGIHSAGLRIPEDVSFVAYGDSPWYRAYAPPISTVRHVYDAAAREAVRRIVARIEGKPIPETPSDAAEFVSRGSIGPAPDLSEST